MKKIYQITIGKKSYQYRKLSELCSDNGLNYTNVNYKVNRSNGVWEDDGTKVESINVKKRLGQLVQYKDGNGNTQRHILKDDEIFGDVWELENGEQFVFD